MNGEVARELGRKVGHDLLVKKAAATYAEIFEKIASKLGARAGLNSAEIRELVKSAAMSRRERALAYGAGGAGLGSALGPLGTAIGGIGGGLYGYFSGDDEEENPYVKQIQQAEAARNAAAKAGMPWLGPQAPKTGKNKWKPDYSQFSTGGADGGAESKDLFSPAVMKTYARMGFDPVRQQQREQAFRDYAAGAAVKDQLAKRWMQLSAQRFF